MADSEKARPVSRRERRAARRPPIESDSQVVEPPIRIVCTDKRQHKAMAFGRRPGEYQDGALSVRCPGCKRDVQLAAATFKKIVSGLHAAGIDELDISALPAHFGASRP